VRERCYTRQLVLSLLLTFACSASAEVIFVKASSGGWKNAHSSLHAALKAAKKGDTIWVAQGTYVTGGASFQMKDGVDLIGGWAGNERSIKQRELQDNETILDGQNKTDHVIIGADDALLEGFTITGGQAKRAGRGQGRPPRGERPSEGRQRQGQGQVRGQGRGQRQGPPTRGDFGGRGGSHTTPDQIAQGGGAGAGGGMLNFGVSPEVIDCIFY